MRKDYIGFGFNPTESENHFYVTIPSVQDTDDHVSVYERFHWEAEGEQKIQRKDILKLEISRHKWKLLVDTVTNEFNGRLKQDKLPVGKFTTGGVPLEKRFGKELMVLLWAIENNDPSGIPTALRNWLGLQPEERWWLYTITNASTGTINDSKRGWRVALRYALCENPVDDRPYRQLSLTDMLEGDQ